MPATRDLACGFIVCGIGLSAVLVGRQYTIGTLDQMGPGFFPVSLGIILAAIGAVLIFLAVIAPAEIPAEVTNADTATSERRSLNWRPWVGIPAGLVAFVFLGNHGGLIPAVFAIVFISALADVTNTLRGAVVLALAMVVICIIVFSWGLRLQMPLWTWR